MGNPEHEPLITPRPLEQKPNNGWPWTSKLGIAALVWVALAGVWSSYHGEIAGPTCGWGIGRFKNDTFDWYKLEPHAKLKWVPCYDKLECTRLKVPLDYSDPHGESAAIALAKVPAKVSADSKEYRGPVLFNPGGPGGSGVSLVQKYGHLFHEILGNEYDIIGFDPRGIGHTTPIVNVFGSDTISRSLWEVREQDAPLFNQTIDAIPRAIARAKLYNELIAEKLENVAKHTSTAVVSRDMLSITEAHGRDKLQYWGFSYGSVLGTTFAAMFPDNVGRLIVDGVVDVENYYQGLWSNNLRDAESILGRVATECSSKPDECPLYESSPTAVLARLNAIVDGLVLKPIPVHNGTHNVGFIDHNSVHQRIFQALYQPYRYIGSLFEAFADLEKGNAWKMHNMLDYMEPQFDCHCKARKSQEDIQGEGAEAMRAVACTDAGAFPDDPRAIEEVFKRIAEDSTYADYWVQIPTGCIGWKVEPKWRFNGPLAGNTSFPLLFIGNTGDPVTPIWAAHKTAKGYKDAVVLTQNSIGHCSISGTSVCTHKAIRDYFREGILPSPGAYCEVTDQVFGNKTEEIAKVLQKLSQEDQRLWEVARKLSEQVELPRLGRV